MRAFRNLSEYDAGVKSDMCKQTRIVGRFRRAGDTFDVGHGARDIFSLLFPLFPVEETAGANPFRRSARLKGFGTISELMRKPVLIIYRHTLCLNI